MQVLSCSSTDHWNTKLGLIYYANSCTLNQLFLTTALKGRWVPGVGDPSQPQGLSRADQIISRYLFKLHGKLLYMSSPLSKPSYYFIFG